MTMRIGLRLVPLVLTLLTAPSMSTAQPLPDLGLEELMRLDAGRVFGASERMQPVTEAPSSVSFVTAEEIARQGYRSLAEILRGVRGLYVTDDRNFSVVGARGFGKPGDYNTRVLLLVNGHRVNDSVFGQAEIGPEFGMDPAMFERVEIIRGPASSLYGDSAFFAVVNVITKPGAALERGTITVETGTLGTRLVRGSSGHRFANGVEMAVSGTLESSNGVDRLYFPAFDAPETNFGVAQGLDGEHVGEFYSHATAGPFKFTGAYGRRRRHIPTASFGTVFNEQTFREQTVDRHVLADLEYERRVGAGRVSIRGAYDGFSYDGIYPMAPATADSPALVAATGALGTRWSVGARVTHPLPGTHVVTAGLELIDNLAQNQWARYVDPPFDLFEANRSTLQQAAYVQDEVKLGRWFIVNAGARFDHYEAFNRVTPRAALIVTPSSNQSFKYLFGQAFRAPNAYELNEFYFGEQTRLLRPETIDTHEAVWERYTNDWLRTSVSTYWYKADRLISQAPDPAAFVGTTFVNEGQVRAAGLELEAQMRLPRNVQGMMSYALQRTRDRDTGSTLVNSPAQMIKGRFSALGPWRGSSVSLEVIGMSSRKTLAGATLGAAATTDVAFTMPASRTFTFTATVRNLFDQEYSDPATSNHVQDAIPQNGRTLRVGLRWSPWSN